MLYEGIWSDRRNLRRGVSMDRKIIKKNCMKVLSWLLIFDIKFDLMTLYLMILLRLDFFYIYPIRYDQ